MIDPKVYDFKPKVDFFKIEWDEKKSGYEIFPDFQVIKSRDLIARGNDFYAIWVEDRGLWSTDENDVIAIVDGEVDRFVRECKDCFDARVRARHMISARTRLIDEFHKYCQKQLRSTNKTLDEKIIFSNTKVKKTDYASKKLPYPLEKGSYESYDKLMSVLYSPEERHKLEWAIGAVISGDSKDIQKFIVLYGAPKSGKSTFLNILQKLFTIDEQKGTGYWAAFDAKVLGQAGKDFAFEAFRDNPLIAIQHDGDLSKIEDNTRLNSLVSHETVLMNVKFRSSYPARINSFLFMGTNKPVKITDAKSGILRRLIDVHPTGDRVPSAEYTKLMKQINFELGAIAYHCLEVYQEDPGAYDQYVPTMMLDASNDFYNFITDEFYEFGPEDGIGRQAAWEKYVQYCDKMKVRYPFPYRAFKEEFAAYFDELYERFTLEDGTRVRNYYRCLNLEKFKPKNDISPPKKQQEKPKGWIELKKQHSLLDDILESCPAQYATSDEIPLKSWDETKSILSALNTSKLHYVLVPLNHIVIDFDIPDENGNKSLERNLEAANKWPKTYAEVSKSGCAIHLHYIFTGDPELLERVYDDHIEIKVFSGKQSLRRKLTLCNDIPVATISSGLPMKGEKPMVNTKRVKTQTGLVKQIKRNLNKEVFDSTRQSMSMIAKLVEEAYESGMEYDISDMYGALMTFALNSTNNSQYCLKLLNKMHLKSDGELEPANDISEDDESKLVFYDIEVFPNLLVICWKMRGKDNPVVKMINPDPEEVRKFIESYRLVGFNCRKYDNHIVYGRAYYEDSIPDCYKRSVNIIQKKTGFIGEGYNVSETDVLDFSAKKQSLKKFEIEYGAHHQELGIPWDRPVPEELWETVADYCCNDVLATELTFENRYGDYEARKILCALANIFCKRIKSCYNDTTNTLTGRIMFGDDKEPQKEFIYTDLATGEQFAMDGSRVEPEGTFDICNAFPGYEFKDGKNMYRGEDVGFGGYVYAEEGMYSNVVTFDLISAHPTSMIKMTLFGERYTQQLKNLFDLRVALKHKDFDTARKMFDGALIPYLTDEAAAKALSGALKIAINSIYGLTSAHFQNPFYDPRNKNNIVALRAALFMVPLRDAIQEKGFQVCHIKTDSIKVVNPTKDISDFIYAFGRKYGYEFEVEHKFKKFCLVNKATYIAKCADDDPESPGQWTATGAQFAVPYVFKTLFSHEPIDISDLCETKEVRTAIYLDASEKLPDVGREEAELKKLRSDFVKNGNPEYEHFLDIPRVKELKEAIAKGHSYRFVGRVGQFCPILPGHGGAYLMRETTNEKTGETLYSSVTGASDYLWQESEVVKNLKLEKWINKDYYKKLVDDAVHDISEFGDFEWFVSDDNDIPPWEAATEPWNDESTAFDVR